MRSFILNLSPIRAVLICMYPRENGSQEALTLLAISLFLEKEVVNLGSQVTMELFMDKVLYGGKGFNSNTLNYSRPPIVEFINSKDIVISNITFVKEVPIMHS